MAHCIKDDAAGIGIPAFVGTGAFWYWLPDLAPASALFFIPILRPSPKSLAGDKVDSDIGLRSTLE